MTDDVEQFWVGIANHKDATGENDFSELRNFILSMLALPFSNSAIERAFSQRNVIKTKFRNIMQQVMLEALLQICTQHLLQYLNPFASAVKPPCRTGTINGLVMFCRNIYYIDFLCERG